MFNNWFRKEKPIQGIMGIGGGATGYLVGGAGGGFEATGGTIVDDGGYRYHIFTSNGTFSVNAEATIDNLLIVAAGGNGGQSRAGGGGGGGVRNLSNIPVTAQSYPIQIGQTNGTPHGRGGPSSGLGYSATGGGAMQSDTNGNHPHMNGGCGSGGPGNTSGYGVGNLGGYSPPEGQNGGNGSGAIGGGGGGAGSSGINAPGPYPNPGVQGGNGALIPWVPGSYGENRRFAGGGSSTGYGNNVCPPGAPGGGGGSNRSAITNTGGGGGCGGQGAPGIVILRYAA